MTPTAIPEPARIARLEAIGLARAVLHDDLSAYETLLPQDLEGFEESYYALVGLLRGVLTNIEEPDRLLDALRALTLAHPSSADDDNE